MGKRGTGPLQTQHKQGSCCCPPAAIPLPQKLHIERSQLPRAWPASSLPHRGYTQPVSPEGLSWALSSSPVKHRPRLEEDWGKRTIAPWPGGLAPYYQALLMGASGPNVPCRDCLQALASSLTLPGPRCHQCCKPAATGGVIPIVAVNIV